MATNETAMQPKKTGWLWILLAVIFAAAAIGALWWWKFAKPAVSGACNPSQVELSIGSTQTGEGIAFTRAVVTNTGATTCSIEGYPVVSILDDKNENLFTGDALRNDSYPATAINLAPREKAHAVLGLPDAANFSKGECSGDMKTLRMYLPGAEITPDVKSLSTSFTRQVCPGFSVTVFRAGA